MKKAIFLILAMILFNCSKDNDEECAQLYENYIEALGFAGASQAAIDEITSQYNERKDELGCD